ncbi:MAG: hypothetical protein CL524_01075 [Aequorivita sp.]|nr:hypothetical protein [Aequorivita sp.]
MRQELKRSAAKTLCWSLITFISSCLIVYIALGGFGFFEILACDLILRSSLYFIHERAWCECRYGVKPPAVFLCPSQAGEGLQSKHL